MKTLKLITLLCSYKIPFVDSDKENFEIDIFKLKHKLEYIQKKIVHQQKVHTKELQNIEKITRKEVVEKLAEAHNEATVRQRLIIIV